MGVVRLGGSCRRFRSVLPGHLGAEQYCLMEGTKGYLAEAKSDTQHHLELVGNFFIWRNQAIDGLWTMNPEPGFPA